MIEETLLADPDHAVAQTYGVWGEKKLYGRVSLGVHRCAFVVDASATIKRALYGEQPAGHAEIVLGALEAGAR